MAWLLTDSTLCCAPLCPFSATLGQWLKMYPWVEKALKLEKSVIRLERQILLWWDDVHIKTHTHRVSQKKHSSKHLSYYSPNTFQNPRSGSAQENEGTFAQRCCCWLVAKSCATLAVLWTTALQAHLSTEFLRQEYWRGLLFPSPRDLPGPGIKPGSPTLAGGFFTAEPAGKPGCLLLKGLGSGSGPPCFPPVLCCPASPSSRQTTHLVYFTLHDFPISPTWVLQFNHFKPASVSKTEAAPGGELALEMQCVFVNREELNKCWSHHTSNCQAWQWLYA